MRKVLKKYKNNQNKNSQNVDKKEEKLILNNKINNYEISISKLNLEKKLLESQLENIKKDFNNQLILINNLKNNKLQSYQRRINEMKKNEYKNLNDLNMSKRIFELKRKEDSKFYYDKINMLQENNDKLTNENIALDEENKELRNKLQKSNLNSKYKDRIIKSLNEKIQGIYNEYKKLNASLVESNEQSQFQIKQILFDNDKFRQENQMLNLEMKKLRDNLGGFNDNKKGENKSEVLKYKNKCYEYRTRIIALKKRIDELLQNKEYDRVNSEFNHNLMRYKSSMNFFRP